MPKMPVMPAMPKSAALATALAALLLLSACSTPLPTTEPHTARLDLVPGKSTQQEALARMGPPRELRELPRLQLLPDVRQRCMAWDQATLKTLLYRDEFVQTTDFKRHFRQETHVYINRDGLVCASLRWRSRPDGIGASGWSVSGLR